jgi:hypothetical protein
MKVVLLIGLDRSIILIHSTRRYAPRSGHVGDLDDYKESVRERIMAKG